eukprot:7799683-Pyramimonas_sp.AAC.1
MKGNRTQAPLAAAPAPLDGGPARSRPDRIPFPRISRSILLQASSHLHRLPLAQADAGKEAAARLIPGQRQILAGRIG